MKSHRYPFILWSCLALLIFSNAAHAGFQFGLLGGLAISGSELHSHAIPENTFSSDVSTKKIGFEADYLTSSGNFGIEIDALYFEYKWNQKTVNGSGGFQNIYSNQYIEVPVFFDFLALHPLKFGIGPVFDLATHAEQNYSDFNFNIGFQAGYVHPIGSQLNFSFDVRYELGLSEVSTTPYVSHKNRCFDFLVGLTFKL